MTPERLAEIRWRTANDDDFGLAVSHVVRELLAAYDAAVERAAAAEVIAASVETHCTVLVTRIETDAIRIAELTAALEAARVALSASMDEICDNPEHTIAVAAGNEMARRQIDAALGRKE